MKETLELIRQYDEESAAIATFLVAILIITIVGIVYIIDAIRGK